MLLISLLHAVLTRFINDTQKQVANAPYLQLLPSHPHLFIHSLLSPFI